MNNLIFSMYFRLEDDELDKEDYEKNIFSRDQQDYYQSHLWLNKMSYSKKNNCDFILFDDVENLNNFSKQFDSDIPKYVKINFYKLHLLDKLAEEYDNILYLDHDVYIDTQENIFNSLDLNKLHVWFEDIKEDMIEFIHVYNDRELYSRSYVSKCLSSYLASFTFDWKIDYKKFNTGIILSNSEQIKKLKFKKYLDFLLAHYKMIYYNMDIPENLRRRFQLNNEALFANIVAEEKINVENLNGKWHTILTGSDSKETFDAGNNNFYHFINKQFKWILSDSRHQ